MCHTNCSLVKYILRTFLWDITAEYIPPSQLFWALFFLGFRTISRFNDSASDESFFISKVSVNILEYIFIFLCLLQVPIFDGQYVQQHNYDGIIFSIHNSFVLVNILDTVSISHSYNGDPIGINLFHQPPCQDMYFPTWIKIQWN